MTELSKLNQIAAHIQKQLSKSAEFPTTDSFASNRGKYERVDIIGGSLFYDKNYKEVAFLDKSNPEDCYAKDYLTGATFNNCNALGDKVFKRMTTKDYTLDDANYNGRLDREDEITFTDENGKTKTMDIGYFLTLYKK